ncbi:unnamed protein product [Cuscuta campestris]|uniref:Uncharacterized protein n=1 Tax=Cuscuta campestris TaxID=132261 RepID=A0A484KH27_9ASTE|nr:unnamed protein product [Cuscuta campestris]
MVKTVWFQFGPVSGPSFSPIQFPVRTRQDRCPLSLKPSTPSTETNSEPYFLIIFAYSPRPSLKDITCRSSTIEEHTDREKAQLRERKRIQLELITGRIGGGRSD